MIPVITLGAQIRIDVQLLPEEHQIKGSEWIFWENPPEEAWFVLLANLGREENPYLSGRALDEAYVSGFDPAWTKLEGVYWEGDEGTRELPYELLPAPPTLQTYSLDDVLLRVEIPRSEGKLRIDFRTRFPQLWIGEPGRLGDIYTWRFGWHPLPISAPPQDGYWPLVLPAHRYEVNLTVPRAWVAALPGDVEREEQKESSTFRAHFPGPVRTVALLIGPEEELRFVHLPLEGVTVDAVALSGDEDKVRALSTYVQEILNYYGERFGPYPYGRLLLVEHPNEAGVAMAADGVAFLPRWLFEREDLTAEGLLSRYGRFVLAHELAHQWWGVGVGVDLDAENWLSEGLAQYSAISWFEESFGAEGGNLFVLEGKGLGEAMADSLVGFANLREHLTELPYLDVSFMDFDEAVVKPTSEVRYAQASSVRLYDKGYLVLRALAHLVGEGSFDAALRQAHARFQGRNMSVEEFKALLEEETGQDLSTFFRSWVWGDARADYVVEGVSGRREEDKFVTTVHLAREGGGFLPVEVEVRGPEEKRASQVWSPGEAPADTLVFETAFPVREVIVDPGHYALDVDRLNNVWPRRFVMAAGKNVLPLDGFLVQADPESRAVEVRYLDRFGWAIYPEALAAAGWVRYGREGEVQGFARISGTLIGELTLIRHLWSQPETGFAGTYWEPVGDFVLSLSRRPYLTVGLRLSWREGVTRVYGGAATLLAVPGQGGCLSLRHTQELPLAPHTYLDLTLGVGLANPGLPVELSFGLPELHTLENGPRGNRKLLVSASLFLPPDRTPYSLAGMALISQVTPRAFLTLGRLWTDETGFSKIPSYAEVGGELRLRIELLGGLIPLDGVLGVAWPLPEGSGIFYFGLKAGP